MEATDGRRRAIIEGVKPEVDGGRFPIKRAIGETVVVEADIFTDGHDLLSCRLLYREAASSQWLEAPMRFLLNDRWRGEFTVNQLGRYRYTLTAWVDHFLTWRHDLSRRVQAEDVEVALLQGADMVEAAARRAEGEDAQRLHEWAGRLRDDGSLEERREAAMSEALLGLMTRNPDRSLASTYAKELEVVVDRERARFSAWYEFFPRSCTDNPAEHGTFANAEGRLPYVAEMGFDVIYLPPIHPIGWCNRKGPNNSLVAGPEDPGSPWAIGAEEGGHKAIHPRLGSLDDFHRFIARARELGMEVAIDIAFQTSPEHPYVREHPQCSGQEKHEPSTGQQHVVAATPPPHGVAEAKHHQRTTHEPHVPCLGIVPALDLVSPVVQPEHGAPEVCEQTGVLVLLLALEPQSHRLAYEVLIWVLEGKAQQGCGDHHSYREQQ